MLLLSTLMHGLIICNICPNRTSVQTENDQRMREVEHGCFTPLVFLAGRRSGPGATSVLKRITNILPLQ